MANRARKLRLSAGLLLFALLGSPCQRQASSSSPVAEEVFEKLNAWRRENARPALEQVPQFDRAAERRAAEIAARPRPGRLNGRSDLTEFLRRAGVRYVARATEYLLTERGYDDPAAYVMDRWREDPQAAKVALDPEWDVAGIGTARAEDGTLVVAAILVQQIEPQADYASFERRIEQMVNEARGRERLPALAHSNLLAEVARAHSEDMARNHYMGHDDLQDHGPDWRMRQRGIRYRKVGENVAQNQGWEDPARRAVEGWLESPGHRHNIMDRDYTQSGVGVVLDPESGTYYFTQLFLQPPSGRSRGAR